MIDIENVNKAYHGCTVLKDVCMSLPRGEVVGFIGANGSGKTALLKIICGFSRADSGKVLWKNKCIGKDIDFPSGAGIMIDRPGFFPTYSARDNLLLLASHRKKVNKQQVDAAIAMVGLDPHNRKPVGTYSMGMQQRLCFAQAIMEEPELLILDEPFNSLDQKWSEWMKEKIKQYAARDKLIILTGHGMDGEIDYLCTRTYLFHDGTVEQQ